MSARTDRLEIVRGDSGWFWRFIAKNGKQLARSSETYRRRRDADRSARVVLAYNSHAAGVRFDDGKLCRRLPVPHGNFTVRHVDERTGAGR